MSNAIEQIYFQNLEKERAEFRKELEILKKENEDLFKSIKEQKKEMIDMECRLRRSNNYTVYDELPKLKKEILEEVNKRMDKMFDKHNKLENDVRGTKIYCKHLDKELTEHIGPALQEILNVITHIPKCKH